MAAQKKQYESVSDLLRDVTGDGELADELEQEIAQRLVIKQLLVLRAKKGLSQKDIAQRMDCSQSRVSKLENGRDENLRLGDLSAYCNALDLQCGLRISPRNATPLDEVKQHAFAIRAVLDRLVSLTGDDEVMAAGVASLCGETITNCIRLVSEAAKKLPENSLTDKPFIRVEMVELVPASAEPDGLSSSPVSSSSSTCRPKREAIA